MSETDKSVVFINRVYPPGSGATGELLAELAESLASRGWRVTVIANRPTDVKAKREDRNGVRIEWIGGLPFTRRSHWRRALSYLSLYPAFLFRALRLPRAGTVVLLTDPPLVLTLGPFLRFWKRSRMVHWAQDIYPEVAEQLGVLKAGSLLARVLRRISTWALCKCNRVIAVGSCMRTRLVSRGIPAERIEVIPNWCNPDEIRPSPAEAGQIRAEMGLADRFVAMYSGNIGLAYTFDAMLDAAALLRARESRIVFAVVGDGPRLNSLKEQTAARGLDNVRFFPSQPRTRLAGSLGAADLHLISLREGLNGLVVPSKVYGVLAAGRPALFLGPRESEVAQLILRNDCGSVLSSASGEAVAACLLEWADNPGKTQAAGSRARLAIESTGLPETVAAFERILSAG